MGLRRVALHPLAMSANMDCMATLGGLIKELRLDDGRGVRAFARDIGVAPSFVLDIEADRRMPGVETLAKIADALEVPLSSLQALDPRLPPQEAEALRLAIAGDWDVVMGHLGDLEDWRLERLQKAADMLDAVTMELLGRRHS